MNKCPSQIPTEEWDCQARVGVGREKCSRSTIIAFCRAKARNLFGSSSSVLHTEIPISPFSETRSKQHECNPKTDSFLAPSFSCCCMLASSLSCWNCNLWRCCHYSFAVFTSAVSSSSSSFSTFGTIKVQYTQYTLLVDATEYRQTVSRGSPREEVG